MSLLQEIGTLRSEDATAAKNVAKKSDELPKKDV